MPVFKTYQDWQRQLEEQPVLFLGRELQEYDCHARVELGTYLHAPATDLVFIPNATYGVNIISRSLDLRPGDEILTSDHEYGACDYAWEFVCSKTGASYIHQPISLPICSEDEIVEQFWEGITPRTKVIFLSHITSPTALRIPIEKICQRAKQAEIITLIDGAHAPGQISVDLQAIGADFYVGNCHKWMLSPKGAGFLFARPEVQKLIEPLIVSWGYHATETTTSGSIFVDYLQWRGTTDPAASLTVPTAIKFMQEYDWDSVRKQCNQLLTQAIQRICTLVRLPAPYPLGSNFYCQLGIAPLPPSTDLNLLKIRLYDEYHIEIPLTQYLDQQFIRISIQAYNSQDDIDQLVNALQILIPQVQR